MGGEGFPYLRWGGLKPWLGIPRTLASANDVTRYHLNYYFHLQICASFRSYVTLQRFIPLIAPEAPTSLVPGYGSSARAPNFDDLSLFEYHSYIKMDTPSPLCNGLCWLRKVLSPSWNVDQFSASLRLTAGVAIFWCWEHVLYRKFCRHQ